MCHCDVEQFSRGEHLAEAAGGRVVREQLVRQLWREDGGGRISGKDVRMGACKKGTIHSWLCY